MASQPQDAHLQDVTRPRYPSADGEHLPQTESPQDASASSPANMMPYNCQPCVRRKIKCDRMIPICTSCVRAKQDCVYQAPPKPRRKKRKGNPGEGDDPEPHEDVHQRLARYERILRSHGLLDSLSPAAEDKEDSPPISSYQGPLSLKFSGTAGPQGRLLSGDGKSRYVQSNLWLDTETSEDVQDPFDDTADEPHEVPAGLTSTNLGHNLISGALLGNFHDLLEFHPSHEHAAKLWELHTQNAEPLVRILHVKSTSEMVDAVSRNPSAATRAQECQLFAIYHFAVFSLEEDECLRDFGEERRALLFKYERALWQALINASWLKTTEMPVLQAVVLFLLCARSYIDPQTYWMLTGITVRIAQRMGLHRDGETLGLPPFEVQMRRRVFWQIILLDGFAGQHSGTGINLTPKSWDVKKPLNVGDNQIYPGMTEISETKDGATDMLFVLTRIELSEFFSRTNPRPRDHDDKNGPTKPQEEGLRYIDEVEKTIESKYLRYCDIINPVHYLLVVLARSAANMVRLRSRLLALKNTTIDDAERRELCALAFKIMDSDDAIRRHWDLRRFRWQMKDAFLWDALTCVVSSLTQRGFFTQSELDSTWSKMASVWEHHPELLSAWRPVQLSAGKAVLDAWTANPPSTTDPEPAFITMLKAKRNKAKRRPTARVAESEGSSRIGSVEEASVSDESIGSWDVTGFEDVNGGLETNSMGDWVFWNQFFLNSD